MAELPKQLPPDVAAALSRGNLIEAIKLLRGKYNIGLGEAKAFLEALQKQANAQAPGKATPKPEKAPQATVGMQRGQHQPHTAETIHIDPHHSPGEVPRTSNGAIFAAVLLVVMFVLGAAFYFG